MTRAFVFPGQGSQTVGMGKDLADNFSAARLLFEEVDDALGQTLSNIIFEGPEDALTLTENAQPALMAVSLAVMRTLNAESGSDIAASAAFVAGHSLGEYSALAAVGSIPVAATAILLKARGRAMQQAVPAGAGAMAAVLGLELEAAEEVAAAAAQDGSCTVANDNAPGQVVLSGDSAAIDRAMDLAKTEGARRSIKLTVSAPFHCPLMAPATDVMRDALEKIDIAPPVPRLIANVTAAATSDPDEIKALLVAQVTGRVRWRETILAMAAGGVDQTVEIGAGKVLAGLNRRIDNSLECTSVATPDDIDAFLNTL